MSKERWWVILITSGTISHIEKIKIILFKIEIPRKYQSFCGRSDQRNTDEDREKDKCSLDGKLQSFFFKLGPPGPDIDGSELV